MRDSILTKRKSWIEMTRADLTDRKFSSVEQSIKQGPHASIEILDGLFAVERSSNAGPGSVLPTLEGSFDPHGHR